jgi:hypothetical protein
MIVDVIALFNTENCIPTYAGLSNFKHHQLPTLVILYSNENYKLHAIITIYNES